VSETIQEIRRLKPAAVVVDSADVNAPYLNELVSTGVLVASFDHMAKTPVSANLLINPLLAPSRDAYELSPDTQVLLGRRYAVVRPEFRRVRQVRAQEPPAPFRAVIALADDDFEGTAVAFIKLLLPVSRVERIDILARSNSPALDDLRALADAHPNRVSIGTETTDITTRVGRSHFAVTCGDSWSLELACVGIPQLMVLHRQEAHVLTARRLEDEGAGLILGPLDKLTPGSVRQAVHELLGDPFERQMMSRSGRKLIDGRGPDRLVTALEVMLHPSRLIHMYDAA
jgi:spore coat polysaccharide biosynthesis predicted glycosyltransferase SpsG